MGATNCPETPRQKMITMMYLVYTAMLALNVSAQVVDGFKTVGSAMTKSNENLQEKLDDTYANFDNALKNSPDKVKADYDKAQKVRQLSTEMGGYIDSLMYVLMAKINPTAEIHPDLDNPKYKYDMKVVNPDKSPNFDSIKKAIDIAGFRWLKMDELHESTNLFSSDPGKGGKGIELKNKIIEYKRKIKEILGEDSSNVNIALNVENKVLDPDNNKKDWEVVNFYEVVSGSSLVTLTRLKAETMNAEFDAVNTLYKHISKGDFTFDKVDLISRPVSTYIIQGGTYETRINVGAYNTKEQFVATVNGQSISSVDGTVTYKVACPTTGPKKVNIKSTLKTPDGNMQDIVIEDEYFVAQPMGSVQFDNLMVMYTGIENPLTITAAGIDYRNITVKTVGFDATISKSPEGEGHYIITPKPGITAKTGTIQLIAQVDGKAKEIANTKVKLKEIPRPELKVNGAVSGSSLSRKELSSSMTVTLEMGKDFLFKIDRKQLQIIDMQVIVNNAPINVQGRNMTPDVYSAIKRASSGSNFVIRAKVRMPDGKIQEPIYVATLK